MSPPRKRPRLGEPPELKSSTSNTKKFESPDPSPGSSDATAQLPSHQSSTPPPPGKYAALLTQGGDQRLRIGVNYGTANTCASWVVVSPTRGDIFTYVKKVKPLACRDKSIRFPTIMAIVCLTDRTTRKPLSLLLNMQHKIY